MKKIKNPITRIRAIFSLSRYWIGEVAGKDIPQEWEGKAVLFYRKGWIYTT